MRTLHGYRLHHTPTSHALQCPILPCPAPSPRHPSAVAHKASDAEVAQEVVSESLKDVPVGLEGSHGDGLRGLHVLKRGRGERAGREEGEG